MALPVALLYIYGILLLLGGVLGYAKAKSAPSLIAGGLCGLVALLLAYDYPWHFAPHAALLLSVFLIGVMGRRYLRTRKAMPALAIVALSLVVAVTQLFVIFRPGT